MDIKDGFLHVELDDDSSRVCVIATPFGNNRFNRLPPGLKIGPQVFQRKNHENFGDIQNCKVFMDDIMVHGKTKQSHDETLKKVLDRAKEKNIRFKVEKLQIAKSQVKYLGHIFSEEGIRPDPDRIRSIQHLGNPVDKKDLQKFLGVVNYLRSFISNLAEETTSLRELQKS